MSELLFLAHRIPYPPDKGDKIRSYHFLRALAAEHTVHLGTFVDDEADQVHIPAVRDLCKGEVCIRPLSPRMARMRSSLGLLTGDPLTVAYYRDATMLRWVREHAERGGLGGVFAFSSSMAQYAEACRPRERSPRVLDLCDVDSDKWRQYVATSSFPMNRVYAREARLLQRLERRFTQSFDRCLVISEAEASILRDSQGDAGNVVVVPNGVDTGYFDPALEFASPFDAGCRSVVFTGAMDYYANIDGVVWFVDNVWRRVHAGAPDALFHIVGSNPTRDVLALRERPGVRVVGRVPDMRPYLAHANVVVAPLRLARGVQNKVLEALAMARPVVATSNALQGISAAAEGGVRVADDGKAFAEQVLGCLTAAFPGGHAGRDFVTARFCWQSSLDLVCAMFRAVGTPVRPGSIASAA